MAFVNRYGWWSTQIDGVSIFDEDVEEGQVVENIVIPKVEDEYYEEILSTVKNMVDAVGLFEYGCNLSGALAEDEKEEKDLSQKKVYLKMLEVGSNFTNGCLDIRCERCLAPRGIVRSRGISWYNGIPWDSNNGSHASTSNFIDDLEVRDLGHFVRCAELVCRSCTFSELEENEETYELVETGHEWCMCCNLCDGLTRRDGTSLRGTFIHTPGEEEDEIRCYECHASRLEEFCMAVRGTEVCYDYEEPYVMCSECGIECRSLISCEHVAAANPPLMIYNGEDSENICDIVCDECGGFSSWDCICPRSDIIEEVDRAFEGEFENVELPENNSEKASEIKDVVKELGEEMYDLQETLSEGQYLKMMNLLQKITNKVNAL
mgnify:CR=1 FL=1|tara:strand:+ start:3859 stop:4989 length:1131 start_codon:yes stop_codon:yes gene_type:complete